MEAYTYSNLFDTKGIEYIVIIFFLLLLIPFWIVVNRKSDAVNRLKQAVQALTAGALSIPQGLFFSRNHTWLQLEKSGEARIGLDDFLVKVTGAVLIEPLKSAGDKVKKGEAIASISQGDKQLKVHSPISGLVSGFNAGLTEDGALLAESPYDEGWLFTMEPEDWKKDTTGFLLGQETRSWMEGEIQRLKDFLSISFSKHNDSSMALVFQEGGELQMNPLTDLGSVVWNDFQNEFLEQTD